MGAGLAAPSAAAKTMGDVHLHVTLPGLTFVFSRQCNRDFFVLERVSERGPAGQ
jgi:hypothetical protein